MVCSTLGWTWDQADEQLDFPRLKVFYGIWEKVPPVAVSLAWIAREFGLKTQQSGGSAPVPAVSVDKVAGQVLDMLIGDAPQSSADKTGP